MNITQGNVFWEKDMKIKYNYPYITRDRKCDILVIGGGISGALSAYYQARQGYNVIIVEKNLIGFNSTLENIGILMGKNDYVDISKKKNPKDKEKINTLSMQALHEMVEIINEINSFKEEKEKINYSICDMIQFSDKATGKFTLSRQYDEEIKNDKYIEYIEDSDYLDIYCGIKYKNKGLIINPYVFCQELINMLSKLENVEVYENTFVESINSKENEVEAMTSNRFKIHAKKVILATGISMAKYLKEEDLELYKTYNIVANLSENINSKPLIAWDNANNSKLIRMVNNNIILNGEDIRIQELSLKHNYEEKFANGKYKRLYNHLLRILDSDNVKIKNCFYGLYLMTKDRLPIIDELPNMPNVYCNLGVGKNGIIYNLIGAKILKNIYSDCYTKDMHLFIIDR